MKKHPYKYKHIVLNKVADLENPHPLENLKDKKLFIQYLLKDLNIEDCEDISENKNNLFRIYFHNLYYNIFIEFPDGGGKDISFNKTSKKVSIPFHQNAFKKIISNNGRVLVINIYTPLINISGEHDFSERIYLIVDPNEIYQSKVIEKETNNSSSRWFTLEDILDVMKNKTYKFNNKKNVYIVYWEKLQWFFDNVLQDKYTKMINSELGKINISNLRDKNNKEYQKYRRLFRESLINNRGIQCEIINCKINILELMVASHIKPVNAIISDNHLDNSQKIIEISDSNNGFLLCSIHDALFDKFLITFSDEGVLKISNNIINQAPYLNLINNEKNINISSQEVIKYLNFHNCEFKNKELKKINL